MNLTPTSFAILAPLEDREWSAYELATHWEQSELALLLPRARSNVYRELKRLETGGFVTSTTEPSPALFGRTRSLYSITSIGRSALREWREGTSDQAFTLESEALLRLALSSGDDPEVLARALDAIRAEVIARREIRIRAQASGPDVGDPDGAHWRLLETLDRMLLGWCAEMDTSVSES